MFIRALTVVAAGYLLGNLNGAVLLSRLLAHDDVRRHGSGNAGFTNFCRNYGGLTGTPIKITIRQKGDKEDTQ